MCDPVTAGLILTAASGGVSAINNNNALRRQDREAARGIRNNAANQRKANDRVNQEIDAIAANTGESERADALTAFQNALRSGREETEGSLQPVGAANVRFAEKVGDGKRALQTAGGEQAERLSIIDGILRQRTNENAGVGRAASDLRAIQNDVTAEDFLTKLRVAGKRPNVLIDAIASIGQGVGSGLALRAPKPKFNLDTIVDAPVRPLPSTVFG